MRGISLINAVVLVAEVGDFTRFSTPRQLMAYFALVPGERSSGESARRTGITKACNSHVRRALVEGAWAYRMRARIVTRSIGSRRCQKPFAPARALLDNFVSRRSRKGTVSRTLTKAEMEAHFEKLLRQSGEDQLNKLRDEARRTAPKLKRQKELKALSKMIGAILNRLQTPVARARRKGLPFDPQRSELFEQLRAELHRTPPPDTPCIS